MWDTLLITNIVSTNPKNHLRERGYWEKANIWMIDDPRFNETETPTDMMTIEVTLGEKLKALAKEYPGLSEIF